MWVFATSFVVILYVGVCSFFRFAFYVIIIYVGGCSFCPCTCFIMYMEEWIQSERGLKKEEQNVNRRLATFSTYFECNHILVVEEGVGYSSLLTFAFVPPVLCVRVCVCACEREREREGGETHSSHNSNNNTYIFYSAIPR